MTGLGESARLDSGAMRTIAVVTMAFLAPTFLSVRLPPPLLAHANREQAIFSMSFFNYTPGPGSAKGEWSVSEEFWVYWVCATLLTCLTMAIWY